MGLNREVSGRLVVALLGVLLVVAACGSDPEPPRPPAQAAGQEYVNLGDSYASGTGVDPLQQDSPFFCQRSAGDYARIVAARTGRVLTDVSCARATTKHLDTAQYDGVPPQLDALSDETGLVTLMLGGNDNGTFGTSVSVCGKAAKTDPSGSPCTDGAGAGLLGPIDAETYPALVGGLREIRERAPNADILIIGYPWIMAATGGCYPDMPIAEGDVPFMRELQTRLNSAVSRAAAKAGVTYVDMSKVSDGHDACAPEGVRWVEPQSNRSASANLFGGLHPNAAGQRAIAEQVLAALNRRSGG